MQKKKLLYIFGTRPEAIKMAPLIIRMKATSIFDNCICVTGQHKELLDSALTTFELEPDYDLQVMTAGQELSTLTSKILQGLGAILTRERPNLIIVQGDTTSAMAGALAAFYHKIPVAHLEAGLRTTSKSDPFPEEMNRRIISQIADYHFAPTERNKQNLKEIGITDSVFVTGNTGLDALKYFDDEIQKKNLKISSQLEGVILEKFLLVTIHRRENHGENLESITSELIEISKKFPEFSLLVIRHPNPKLSRLEKLLNEHSRVVILDPVSYPDMVHLIKKAQLIITDSGGLQEESAFIGTPTIVIRNSTERTEAVDEGLTRIVNPHNGHIEASVTEILSNEEVYTKMSRQSTIYGSGNSSELIQKVIEEHYT